MRKKKVWGVIGSLVILFVVLNYPNSCSKKNPPPLISPLRSFAIPCEDLQIGSTFYKDRFSFKFQKKYVLKLPNGRTTSAIELSLRDKKLILFQSFKKTKTHQLDLQVPQLASFSKSVQTFIQNNQTIRSVFIQDPFGNPIQCIEGKKNQFLGVSILVSNLDDILEFYDEILGFQNFYRSGCEGCFANQRSLYESILLHSPQSLRIIFYQSPQKIDSHLGFFLSNCKRFHTLKGLFQLEGFDPSDIYTIDKKPYFWVQDPNHIPLLILKRS